MHDANPAVHPSRPDGVSGFDRFVDEHRLEEVRFAVRRELRVHQGQRALSAAIGVTRGVLRKLVEMRSTPEPRNLQAIREWAEDRAPVPVPIECTCLAILAAGSPPDTRVRVRRALAEALRDAHERSGAGCPEWLAEELAASRR